MPQPPRPLPDGHSGGRYQGRHSAPGGPSGGYPPGGYPNDYQAQYPEQEYQAPPRRQPPGPYDDYPSGEYPTGAFTGGMPSMAPPGSQHDFRATGTFGAANDPMSRYEQHSVYDGPEDRAHPAAYRAGGRSARQTRAGAAAGALEVPWYQEIWVVSMGLAVALVIGVMLGAFLFGG